MILMENGFNIATPRNLAAAKKMIAGLDLSMATVDCDPQHYKVLDSRGKLVYERPRIRIP